MTMASNNSPPLKLLLRALLNIVLVWAMDKMIPDYFSVFGGIPAYVVVGSLLTLMNLFVRPLLKLFTLPVRLFATMVALIIVNGVFMWLIYRITLLMDPNLILVVISGGAGGWMLVSIIIGFYNWLVKLMLK